MGIRKLARVQLGREGTPGTQEAATTIWRGPAGFPDDTRETVFSEEEVGFLSMVDRTHVPKLDGAFVFPETEATYEQIVHILEAGVKTVTPAQDGAGSDYISTYTFPTTAANTIKTYTIEGGDDQGEEETEYSFVEEFSLTASAGEALKMSANWRGRRVQVAAFTGALSLPAVEEILFQKGKLYLDAVAGAFGGTQKTNTLIGMTLRAVTGWMPVWTADGDLFFSFHKNIGPEITCDVTFEHDATAVAEKAIWRAQTPRLMRFEFEGNAVGTPGTTYSNKTLLVDLAGKWENFAIIGEQDGNDIVTGTFRARYNATAAKFAEILVVNEQATVP